MKRWVGLILLLTSVATATPRTFDRFTVEVPRKYTVRESAAVLELMRIDNRRKLFCQIGVYRPVTSVGDAAQDLDSEWNQLVANNYTVKGAPTSRAVSFPGATESMIRMAETSSSIVSSLVTTLVVARFPDSNVSVVFNASSAAAGETCGDDLMTVLGSLQLKAAAPAEGQATAPAEGAGVPSAETPSSSTASTSALAAAWELSIPSMLMTQMRYNMMTKGYDNVSVTVSARYRLDLSASGQYVYESDVSYIQAKSRNVNVERGTFAIVNGLLQLSPKSAQFGSSPLGKTPTMSATDARAPYVKRYTLKGTSLRVEDTNGNGAQLFTKNRT